MGHMKSMKRMKVINGIRGVSLTSKDMDLFRYLHAVKVSTYWRIQRDIYLDLALGTVRLRLIKLENNGLVEGCQVRALNRREKLLNITKKGFNTFVTNDEERMLELKSGSIEHDLLLVDIRYKLLRQERVSLYLTENELQTWGHALEDGNTSSFVKLNSDALIHLQAPRGLLRVPIEYESANRI